jgi:hypothetical protein
MVRENAAGSLRRCQRERLVTSVQPFLDGVGEVDIPEEENEVLQV